VSFTKLGLKLTTSLKLNDSEGSFSITLFISWHIALCVDLKIIK